jgi:hypothetical protein
MLEEKDSLTKEEMQIYIGLKQICEDRINAAALEQQLNKSANAMIFFQAIAVVGICIGIIAVLSK